MYCVSVKLMHPPMLQDEEAKFKPALAVAKSIHNVLHEFYHHEYCRDVY